MLIVDMKENIPLDMNCLNWDSEHIRCINENITAIPMCDQKFDFAVKMFAYAIGSQYAWAWPDLDNITVEMQVDQSYSYLRFSLLVGVKPSESFRDSCEDGWAEFEEKRRKAVQEHGGKMVYGSFPVMLIGNEEHEMRTALYERLGIY